MTEILFYHLRSRPLETVLPGLLERSLARGWRCAVQSGEERARALDDHLWTYADDSFLPHGLEADDGADQPVVLLTHAGNPNGAAVRFMLEGAAFPADLARYDRVVLLFDGHDEDAVATARERWKEAKQAGHAVTYWIEDEAGRWVKRG